MSMGLVYKFFGYSISYTVLNIPCLLCTYQFVLLNPRTLSLILLLPLSADNPPNDLHICDSVPVLLVCLVCFLDSIVDCCEFVAILIFIVLIFSYILPFNISYNNGLVIMNSFHFTLSGNHFICPSILNYNFDG